MTMTESPSATRDTSANTQRVARKSETHQRDEATLLPPVDILEDSGGITVFADLPGVASARER